MSALGGCVGRGAVVGAGGHEVFDVFEGVDAASSSYGSAVEGRCGAGEVELAIEGPVLKQAVDEASVEDVSGSSCVEDGDAIRGGVEELVAVPGQDAVVTKGCGGEAASVATVHLAEGFFEIGLAHEAGWKIAADDEVVDVGEEVFDVGVKLVEVGDDGDSGGLGPGGGCNGGLGVEAVDMESAGVDDPFTVELGRVEGEAFVAATEDGALAFGVDEDEGLGACSAGDGDDAGLDTGVREGFAMEGGGEVVAKFADVAGVHSPVLASNDGGRDLSAGEGADGGVFGLGAADGVVRERDNGVCCVQSDADKVNLRRFRHSFTVNER